MSRENVEVVLRGLEALRRRDWEALRPMVAPDCEWRPILTVGGDLERPVYRGPEGMVRYGADLDDLFEDTEMHIHATEPAGPHHVLFSGRVTARGRLSGVPLDQPIWAIYEVRRGQLAAGTAYRSQAEGREAVQGLEAIQGPGDESGAGSEPLAVVRRCFERWRELSAKLDTDALPGFVAEYHHADVWVDFGTRTLEAVPGHGTEVILAWAQESFKRWREADAGVRYHAEEFIETGDAVVVPARVTGRIAGLDMESRFAYVYRVRDGKISSLTMHETLQEALAVASGDG